MQPLDPVFLAIKLFTAVIEDQPSQVVQISMMVSCIVSVHPSLRGISRIIKEDGDLYELMGSSEDEKKGLFSSPTQRSLKHRYPQFIPSKS